ncbi:MAG TPA: ABC transporter permease [Mycobacteriales bacterium]|jgi:peptide/nickel transport system permease protein|nr:ABC transporter permease [Mycobacteriales bacterium]
MLRFLVRRFFLGLLVLFLVSLAVFFMFFKLNASGPTAVASRICGKQCSTQQINAVKDRLHLNDPFFKQYYYFLFGYPGKSVVNGPQRNRGILHGDLGYSYVNQQSVNGLLKDAFPITLSLAAGSAVLWLLMGLLSGILSAIRPRSMLDRTFTFTALLFYSMPTFVLGLLLLLFLFYELSIHGISFFPAQGYVPLTQNPWEWARHLLLPWFTLAAVTAAAYTRLTRGSMLDVLGEDYIRTARAKGLSERRVIFRHGLRAALTPIVTQFGIDVGTLLGGAIITERVFGLPGLGFQAVQAITANDLPIIIGVVVIATTAIVIANLLVDVFYAVLDPRVRLN